jgi:serine/threonine protein kinase
MTLAKGGDGEQAGVEGKGAPSREVKSARANWNIAFSKVRAIVRLSGRGQAPRPFDFKRIKTLGFGGNGVVYLVQHTITQKYYAMKVQKKPSKKRKQQRMRNERDILITCDHPFITHLHFAFQSGQYIFLVMEYCSGGDMGDLMKRLHANKVMDEDVIRFYLAEIILALHYIHSSGFVYRDLKPQNVLIHDSGHIRLADFGVTERGVRRNDVAATNPPNLMEENGDGMDGGEDAHSIASVSLSDMDSGKSMGDDRLPAKSAIILHSEQTVTPVAWGQDRSVKGGGGGGHTKKGERRKSDIPEISTRPSGRKQTTSLLRRLWKGASNRMGLRTKSASKLTSSPSSCLDDMVELESTSFVGTIHYMAPETVTGDIQSEALDWWALGIVMYQMCFDKFPFEGNTQQAIFDRIVHKDKVTLPSKTTTGTSLSKPAKDLLHKFLVKDRHRRMCSTSGIAELKEHPFFEGIKWDQMESAQPPFKLKAKSIQGFNPQTIDSEFEWFANQTTGSYGGETASSTTVSGKTEEAPRNALANFAYKE